MDDRALRPRSGSSAKALLLTVLGELVLPHGGAVWTSTVVRTMALLDVEERNARQALARLAAEGTLRSAKDGRRARWHLTDTGRRLLVEGTKRIYELGAAGDRWDGRWLVVPEGGRLRRWDLSTGQETAALPDAQRTIWDLVWSADGQLLGEIAPLGQIVGQVVELRALTRTGADVGVSLACRPRTRLDQLPMALPKGDRPGLFD